MTNLPTSTKPIFSKLQTKLALQQTDNPRLYLADVIAPIVDVDFILAQSQGQTTNGTATNRTDDYTVPATKFWKMKTAAMVRANAGDVVFQCVINGVVLSMNYLTSQTKTFIPMYDIKLKAGDIMRISNGNGTSGDIATFIIYEEYDA